MEDIKDNIDIILNKQITKSLLIETRADFSEEVVDAIRMQQRFKTEDKKTNKLAKVLTFISVSLMTVFVFVMAYVLYIKEFEIESDYLSGYMNFISEVNNRISEVIGVDGGFNYLFYTVLILIIIALFSLIDKLIFTRAAR
ncbi:MAG: hypothetical protein JW917_01090 [Ignavibacteria bacterium]|nr:hypothetical protein [Ignavibacteria bacterium]